MKAPLKTPEEIADVLAYADTTWEPAKWRAMLALSFELALRPIEMAQLDTSQFRGNELRIRIGHTKGDRGRSITVVPEVMRALAAYLGDREGPVFLNRDGAPMDAKAISAAMRRLFKEAGQASGSCYSGRRTLLTSLVEADVNILTVQGIAGHRSAATTASYVGITPKMMERALARVSNPDRFVS